MTRLEKRRLLHVLMVPKMDATAAKVILAPKYLDNHLVALACNRGGKGSG